MRRPIRRIICSVIGHSPNPGDWGYGGGKIVDCWCSRCDKMLKIPLTEFSKINPNARRIMWEFIDRDRLHTVQKKV